MLTRQTEVTIKMMIKEVKELQKLANKNRKSLEKLINNTRKASIFRDKSKIINPSKLS